MAWKEYKIEDLFESTITGDWGDNPTVENSVPVVRSTNFSNDGKLDFSKIVYRKVQKSQLERRKILKGNILFEKSGGSPDQPAGRVVYCNIDFGGTCSNFIEIARVKDEFDSKLVFFLLFYFYQIGKVLKYQQQTTGIINFKLNEYKQEKISLPSKREEQTAIAEVLGKIDAAIEQTNKLIEKQKRIKQGLMQDLLTKGIDSRGNIRSEKTHRFKDSPLGRIPEEWEIIKLGDVGSWLSGGTPSKSESRFWNGAIPWISSKDMKQFYLTKYSDFVTEVGAKSGTRLVPKDTVFIVVRGMVLAHTFPVGITTRETAFNQDLRACVCNEQISPLFFAYSLLSNSSKLLQLTSATTHGTKRIDSKDLFDFEIAMPRDKNEQESIVKIFENLDDEINLEIKKHEKLKVAKNGLMQDLLTGKKSVEKLIGE